MSVVTKPETQVETKVEAKQPAKKVKAATAPQPK